MKTERFVFLRVIYTTVKRKNSIKDNKCNSMIKTPEASDESAKLLQSKEKKKTRECCYSREKIWPYLVWLSVFLTKISAAGFNYGIAGSITEVQTRRFDVSLSKSSLTASVHSAVFLGSGKLITFLPALNKLHPILFPLVGLLEYLY